MNFMIDVERSIDSLTSANCGGVFAHARRNVAAERRREDPSRARLLKYWYTSAIRHMLSALRPVQERSGAARRRLANIFWPSENVGHVRRWVWRRRRRLL